MNRREFMGAMGLGALSMAMPGLSRALSGEKPNFLFIFADDMTYEAIQAFGYENVHTPNLDRLVQNGTTFTHAYNQGGWHGAVCVASRTMLVTGAFLWDAQEREENLAGDAGRSMLWPQLLESEGYDTYMSGKWHVKIDAEAIFQNVRHVRPGMPKQTDAGYNRPIEGEEDLWDPSNPKFGGFWEGGKHWSEVLGDDAVDFLAQAKASDNPFFMYLAFNAPHDPRQSPKEYVDRYPLDSVKVPENFQPRYKYDSKIGCGPDLRDEKLAPFPRTEYAVKVNRQEYFAIITHLDDQVGRMLDALDTTGKADNTYVIFTADHGLACGHHGLLGKQNMYDHSVRVPLMITGPGVEKNKRISAPVYLQDVMPTTLDLAGADKPDEVAFESLLPLLENENADHYDALYGAYMHFQRSVTNDHFKLIYYPEIDVKLLFDLKNDPQEMTNLADEPEYADKVDELWAKLQVLQKELRDPLLEAKA